MANTTSFNSFFDEITIDNNKVSTTDINAGLVNLFSFFNEQAHSFSEVQRYLVANHEADYPELVAMHSALGDEKYWWWLLLLNRLDDPFTQLNENWIYSINSPEQINGFVENSNNNNSTKEETRIGTTIELN